MQVMAVIGRMSIVYCKVDEAPCTVLAGDRPMIVATRATPMSHATLVPSQGCLFLCLHYLVMTCRVDDTAGLTALPVLKETAQGPRTVGDGGGGKAQEA